jgi:hypothetical protein
MDELKNAEDTELALMDAPEAVDAADEQVELVTAEKNVNAIITTIRDALLAKSHEEEMALTLNTEEEEETQFTTILAREDSKDDAEVTQTEMAA